MLIVRSSRRQVVETSVCKLSGECSPLPLRISSEFLGALSSWLRFEVSDQSLPPAVPKTAKRTWRRWWIVLLWKDNPAKIFPILKVMVALFVFFEILCFRLNIFQIN